MLLTIFQQWKQCQIFSGPFSLGFISQQVSQVHANHSWQRPTFFFLNCSCSLGISSSWQLVSKDASQYPLALLATEELNYAVIQQRSWRWAVHGNYADHAVLNFVISTAGTLLILPLFYVHWSEQWPTTCYWTHCYEGGGKVTFSMAT
jgi:hypothetical protein